MNLKRTETESKNALLVDPRTRIVRQVAVDGYDGIRECFGLEANIEASPIVVLNQRTILNSWGDCNEFLIGPGWYSSLSPAMPLHGLSVIDASELSTGEATDCPMNAQEFSKTIFWENSDNRTDPGRPNRDWIERFGRGWGWEGHKCFYTMEEVGQ